MTSLAKITLAAVFSVSALTAAFADWDRKSFCVPAFAHGDVEMVGSAPTGTSSATATNDTRRGKPWFGPQRDRFVDSLDSPYDN